MKKSLFVTIFALLLVGILLPSIVNAEDGFVTVAEDTVYYKTIVKENIFNTYSIGTDYDIETVEISKAEYDAFNPATTQPLASGTIETTYKHMTVSILKNSGVFRYKNYLSWKNIPATRSYDVIGIAYPSTVKLGSAMVFTQEYCNATGTCYTNSGHNPEVRTTGALTIFPLPTGSLSRLNQTMYFDVAKNTSSTITTQYVQGDYSHAQSAVSLSKVFGSYAAYGSGNILTSAVEDNYDSISLARAQWTENW